MKKGSVQVAASVPVFLKDEKVNRLQAAELLSQAKQLIDDAIELIISIFPSSLNLQNNDDVAFLS